MGHSVRPLSIAPAAPAALVALAAWACGQVYADPVKQGFGSPSSPGIDSGILAPRLPAVPCPPTEVGENGPCDNEGNVCEYGSSPDPACNTSYRCVQDADYGDYWTEASPPKCPFSCPPSSAIVDGAPCNIAAYGDAGTPDDAAELQCATPNGTCACTTGPDGAHVHPRTWVCRKPAADCPAVRPLLGALCVGEHSCDYGACDFKRGSRMTCQDEVWQIETAACP
jgi:hypothetical protein